MCVCVWTLAHDPNEVARRVAAALFRDEERMDACVTGLKGKQLDTARLEVLKNRFFKICPAPRSQREVVWKSAVQAIDGRSRYLRLKADSHCIRHDSTT